MRMGAAIRVEDLLRSPALQLKLLAGGGGVDRSVSWAHVSELEDPTPWLLGAEMIMTIGMALPRSAAGQRAYVERLDDAGVSALALSEGLRVPPLRAAFFAVSDARHFPVVEVPLPVPFVTVIQEVAAAVQGEVNQRLAAQLRVFGALRWMAAEDLGAAETFERLANLSGYRLYACSPGGRPLMPGLPAPPSSALGLLPSSPSAPPSVPGGFVLPIPAPGGPAGFLLALERDGALPAGLAVVQHIATVAALQLTMERHVAETGRREQAETLAELLRGGIDSLSARQRLERHGFPSGAPLVLAAVRLLRGGRAAGDAIERALGDRDIAHLVLGQADLHFVLAPHGPDLTGGLRAVEGAVGGISAPFPAGDPLDVGRREALWALEQAVATGQLVATYDSGDRAGRWLPTDTSALRSLVQVVLGPVLEYDAERTGSSLVETVQTWLNRNRSSVLTSRELHIHPNTLAYRLRRFSELTARDLSSTGDLAEVWLALSALRSLPTAS